MATSQNIIFIKKLYDDVYNKANFNNLEEFFTSNFQLHDPAVPNFRPGIQSLKQIETAYAKAFPNKKVKLEEIVTTENQAVVARWTCTGTHKGELQGISPTNRDFKISGITIYKFTNGKISEIWQDWDRLGLLEQIGEIQPAHAFH